MEREIEGFIGSIDEAVDELLAAKERGEHVFIDFNGVILHSDTVTLDSAYKSVTGYTKAEFWENVKKDKEEEKNKIQALIDEIPELVEKGKEYIKPELHQDWENFVTSLVPGESMGREVFKTLEILEAASYKKYDEAVNLIDILGKFYNAQLITTAVFKFSVNSQDLMDIYINRKLYNEKKLLGYYFSLDDAVKALLESKSRGEHAYTVFNGVVLHSDTVTLDSAYKEVTGLTKAEHEKAIREEIAESKEYIDHIPSKKDELIEEGKKYIKPELSDSWAKLVEARLDGIWGGIDIEDTIKIMAALDKNEIDKAIEIYESIDSGTAYYFVGQIVRSYSTKAKEFDDAVNEYANKEQVEKIEEKALDGYGIHTLEDAVKKLLAAKERGEHVYYNFNGHVLHSDTVTMDSAYNEVLGYSKAEHDARQKNIYEIRAQQKEDAKKNAINLIVKGQKYIYPELFPKWIKCVNDRVEDLYLGSDVEISLEIMKALDEDDMDKALAIYDTIDSGNAASMVMYIVLEFSKKGPEFVEAAYNHEVPEELLENVNTKKEENALYEKAENFTRK